MTSEGTRPGRRWGVITWGVIAVVALIVAVVVIASGRDGDSGGGTAAKEPSPKAKLNAAAGSPKLDPAVAALLEVGRAKAWADAVPAKTAPAKPFAADPAVKTVCPDISTADLTAAPKEGQVTVSFPDKAPGERAKVIPIGKTNLSTCDTIADWFTNRLKAPATYGAPKLAIGPRTVLTCGAGFAGSVSSKVPPVPGVPAREDGLSGLLVRADSAHCLTSSDANRFAWTVMRPLDEIATLGKCVGCDLSGQSIDGYEGDLQFADSVLDGATLTNLTLGQFLIGGSSLRGVSFRDVAIDKVSVSFQSDLGPAADGTPTTFARTDLTYVLFTFTNLDRSRFHDVTLADDGLHLECTSFHGAVALRSLGADLTKAALGNLDADAGCTGLRSGAIFDVGVALNAAVPAQDIDGAFLYVDPAEPAVLKGANIGAANLRNVTLIGAAPDLSGLKAAKADLSGSNFDHASFFPYRGDPAADAADLSGANLTGASFEGAGLQHARLAGATVAGTNFVEADLASADFSSVKAAAGGSSKANDFTAAYAPGATFSQAQIGRSDFTRAHLHKANFNDADASGANFTGAVLNNADFTSATLRKANFTSAICLSCGFTSADLGNSDTDESGKDTGDDTDGASLVDSFLFGMQMSATRLQGADLSGAQTAVGGDKPESFPWKSRLGQFEMPSATSAVTGGFPGADLTQRVHLCPDHKKPDRGSVDTAGKLVGDGGGCDQHLGSQTIDPPPCLSAGAYRCPARALVWPNKALEDPVAVVRSATTSRWLVALRSGSVVMVEQNGATGAPISLGLGSITAAAAMPDGRFLVAGGSPSRVVLVATDPGSTAPVPFAGRSANRGATPGPGSPLGDGGPATDAVFRSVTGLAVDPLGQVLVADRADHRIRVVDGAGVIRPFAGTTSAGAVAVPTPRLQAKLGGPAGMAMDRYGALYVADPDNSVVWKIDGAGNVSRFAGTGAAGRATQDSPALTKGDATRTFLDHPMAVAVWEVQQLPSTDYGAPVTVLVADTQNHVVNIVNPIGKIVGPLIGKGDTAGDDADTVPLATDARIGEPSALWVDPGSRAVYVVDQANKRIRLVDMARTTAGG